VPPGFVATVPQCVLFGPVCVSARFACASELALTAVFWPPQTGDWRLLLSFPGYVHVFQIDQVTHSISPFRYISTKI
jgi:hypothetical protein